MLISILTVLYILTMVSSMTVVYPKVVLTVVFIPTVAYILSGLHPHSCLHILTIVSSLSDYTVDPRLTGPQLSESSDYPEGKYLAHAQTIPRGRLVWRSPTLTERFGKRSGYARLVAD